MKPTDKNPDQPLNQNIAPPTSAFQNSLQKEAEQYISKKPYQVSLSQNLPAVFKNTQFEDQMPKIAQEYNDFIQTTNANARLKAISNGTSTQKSKPVFSGPFEETIVIDDDDLIEEAFVEEAVVSVVGVTSAVVVSGVNSGLVTSVSAGNSGNTLEAIAGDSIDSTTAKRIKIPMLKPIVFDDWDFSTDTNEKSKIDESAENNVSETMVGESTIGESTIGESTIGESTIGESKIVESTMSGENASDEYRVVFLKCHILG